MKPLAATLRISQRIWTIRLVKCWLQNGKKQLRTAETEKYPHVTFFFSGGRDAELPGETRVLINSPKVATYDLKPEMSAYELAAAVVKEIEAENA